ncbi:PEP-CTERM sorting domain-containing protein [Thalassotalea piscium]
MNFKFPKLAAGLLLSVSCLANVANAGLIDLNTWSQKGSGSNGNWIVAADGSSVLQTINGEPTFFVSNDSFINKEFTGSFGVETTSDDDYIGFVFGFNGLDDFYLFDWKQADQNLSSTTQGFEGFTLSKISTGADVASLNPLWGHTGNGIDVVATNYGSTLGWEDNVNYDFTLGYTNSSITISINGGSFVNENIFNITGLSNNAGSFGFYNASQQSVRYTGFEEDVLVDPKDVPEPTTLAILALGLIGLSSRRFKK